MRTRRVFTLAFILTASLSSSAVQAAGSPEKGKAAFMKNGCWQCHGFDGQGSVAGARIAPDPIPFEALSAFVRNTNGAMPPFGKAMLADEDLVDIYAYLKSIPKAPDPRRIPLLNP